MLINQLSSVSTSIDASDALWQIFTMCSLGTVT